MGADAMTKHDLGALPPWKIAAALLFATLLIGLIGWHFTVAALGAGPKAQPGPVECP